ncbi:hypothetical protein Dsin_025321 [Dipteronia sinensis]|uniref:Uncharacterized protein n=1 Tax=Dipteronia sinensis TaxID=43782 RepID=A0AAE0DX09_9ROSI|nr:hypothetical protein Dsin_025321 [Dipteronia sinensis]
MYYTESLKQDKSPLVSTTTKETNSTVMTPKSRLDFTPRKDPQIRPLVEQDTESLQWMLPDIPPWVKNPDHDQDQHHHHILGGGNLNPDGNSLEESKSPVSLNWELQTYRSSFASKESLHEVECRGVDDQKTKAKGKSKASGSRLADVSASKEST